jgi:hypothetical protein
MSRNSTGKTNGKHGHRLSSRDRTVLVSLGPRRGVKLNTGCRDAGV